DRPHLSAQRAGASESDHQMTASSEQRAVSSKRTEEKGMTRNIFVFICLLLTVLLPTDLPAQGQQASKLPKIGFLVGPSRSFFANRIESFQQGLHSLDYTE